MRRGAREKSAGVEVVGEKPRVAKVSETGCAWVCGEVGWQILGVGAVYSCRDDETLIDHESVVWAVPIAGVCEGCG